jgi:hypothetical protein
VEDDDEEEENPPKRVKKSTAAKSKRRTSGKANGISKGKKSKKSRKSDEVEIEENTNECPMLGYNLFYMINCRGFVRRKGCLGRYYSRMD